jgi:hypothetical protein
VSSSSRGNAQLCQPKERSGGTLPYENWSDNVKRSNDRLDLLTKKDDTATTLRMMRTTRMAGGRRLGLLHGHIRGRSDTRVRGLVPAR